MQVPKYQNNSSPMLPVHEISRGLSSQEPRKPRPNPPPIKALELMGLNLHEEKEPDHDVDVSDVTMMRQKMNHHSEETNELFNLMAR